MSVVKSKVNVANYPYQEELRLVDHRIVQHLKQLEHLRDESAFVTAKLRHDFSEKERVLKNLYENR